MIADTKISAAPDAGALLSNDMLPIARSGNSSAFRASIGSVATYINAQVTTPTYGDNDTSIATTAFVQTAVAPTQNNVGRNRLHNVRFSVNQRSYTSGSALAAAAYAHDRWKAGASGCTYTFTQSQPSTTITITVGSLQQIVESMGVEGGTYTLSWTGTAQGRVNAGAYGASPVTVAGLAVNTAITVEFNTGTLTGVQLEIGSVATALDYGGTPQQQLAECQRFYQTGTAILIISNQTNTGSVQTGGAFTVPMRATPTMLVSSNSNSNIAGFGFVSVSGEFWYTNGTSTVNGTVAINSSFVASADL